MIHRLELSPGLTPCCLALVLTLGCALQRGGERYVESSESSVVSHRGSLGGRNMRIPLLDLLNHHLQKSNPPGV